MQYGHTGLAKMTEDLWDTPFFDYDSWELNVPGRGSTRVLVLLNERAPQLRDSFDT